MRKMKRFIALLVVAMFIFSLAAPVSAATKEEAFDRLKAVSVAVGDQNGDPQYDKNFTRAEAAAIMVNLSGMNSAINSAKGATKFKDVPASHWASGVVNLAVGSGIIKGYPDGTYKPDNNVTYAEMSAMLVQVLGYGPKLKGTWPSNVIGKAAEIGLLDGVTVNDYNAAAVRSNVFLASDNALDIKPLKEMKDGYEEDTLTLMERKLSVTIKGEATVINTPGYGTVDKKKVTLDFTATGVADATIDVIDSINPDDYFGLKVEAWVKDDKIFFFNVKTNSGDIIVDTIKEIRNGSNAVLTANGANQFGLTVAGAIALATDSAPATATDAGTSAVGYIKLDKADKVVTVNGLTRYYRNYKLVQSSNATIGNGASVKVILGSDGKAAYVLAQSFNAGIIDSVDAANEKINLDSDASNAGSITLKDKKYLVYKNNAIASLADLKKGDAVDYIADAGTNSDVSLVYATDKSETVKIAGVLDDGMNKDNTSEIFKFTIGDKTVAGAKTIWVSTNNGDTYAVKGNSRTALTSDFNNILNKDVTLKYNKSGKIGWIIAGSATSDTDIAVLVKYSKVVTTTDTKRYLYVAKFDGTETYYEVTKDSKIDGIKVNESALKIGNALNAGEGNWVGQDGPRIVPNTSSNPAVTTTDIKTGDVVKLNLNTDGTINEIKTYGSDLESGAGYTVNKDNATFQTTTPAGTNLVIADTAKTLKVKTLVAVPGVGGGIAAVNTINATALPAGYIDDVDVVSLSTLKSLDAAFAANAAKVVKDAGKASYIALLDAGQTVSSSSYFGVVIAKGTNTNGNSYATIGHDGKTEDIEGTAPAKNSVVVYTLTTDGKISGSPAAKTAAVVYSIYNIYKVESISDRQLKLIPADASYSDFTGYTPYIIIDLTKTQAWDISDTNVAAAKITTNDIIGRYIQVYDVWNADGNAVVDANSDGDYLDIGDIAPDSVYDFLMMVKK